ncbi:hypothetical protein [Pseudomonas sp.]|uniref:hypothetical protein n=1 Tax=Pseudomonas sp. TaxID=306 RepID=UPI00258E9967|nr:hypothetical protein [Pseudomonas sp.]
MPNGKPTPGPWERSSCIHSRYSIMAGSTCLADVWHTATGDAAANAQMMAAAPELLEALQACLEHGSMTGAEWVEEKARAAIAKAKEEAAEIGGGWND